MITIDYKRLEIKPGDRLLDIGCGPGRHVCGACAYDGVMVIGADLSVDDLNEAKIRIDAHRQFGGRMGGRWALSAADVTALPFPDHYFDHVICSEVLEHIPDDRGAAAEIFRVLKPGGNLAVSVPRYLPERICWALSDAYYSVNGGHVRIYRKRQIERLFNGLGFRAKGSSHYAHGLHTPYWWLKCLVGPDKTLSLPVDLYHRLLTWDIMEKPKITRLLDTILNPVIGKSIVFYFQKHSNH